MNFRTKALGLVTAALLSLSIVSGVSAEDTSATFNENPNGSCTAAASSSTIDFGTYTWTGDHYAFATQPVLNFKVTQTYAPTGTVGCDVSVIASDLTNTGDSSKIVSKNDLQVNQGTGQGAVSQAYIGFTNQIVENGEGDYQFNLVINQLWSNHPGVPAPGTYTGTLTFTTAKYVP